MATQPTPIVDKNGKQTTVHRSIDGEVSQGAERVSGVAPSRKADPSEPLDVWFRFESDDDDDPTYEANTYRKGDGYVIEWCHNDVGQVTRVELDTIEEVNDWYEKNGYSDYTP